MFGGLLIDIFKKKKFTSSKISSLYERNIHFNKNIEEKKLNPLILKKFENEKSKWGKDFSYFIFPYEEKKNKESLIDNETKQYFITFTLSIFFISFGICAVRRSFLFNA